MEQNSKNFSWQTERAEQSAANIMPLAPRHRKPSTSRNWYQLEIFPTHLELIISVFGSFVEGSVISKTANVVDPVEALDAIGNSVHLEDADAVRHRSHCVDLEV